MAGKKAKDYTGRKRSGSKSSPKKSPPKTKTKVQVGRRNRVARNTLAMIGNALGVDKLDGAVVQDCLFRVTEDKAPVCVLIQELEFRQVGSLLVIQPKPTATIEASMGHLPSE